MPPSKRFEKALYEKGLKLVAGVDEAGRGPLAGPVVAAAVILPKNFSIKGLRDSKKLTPKTREKFCVRILKAARSVGIGVIDEKTIDRINILNATHLAMREAVLNLNVFPDHILVDGNFRIKGLKIPQTPIVGGDDRASAIACASIVAKVSRDKMMEEYCRMYPGYKFSKHKGYGTREHFRILKEKGPSPIHRKTFEPVCSILGRFA